MFSRRTQWDRRSNRLSDAVEEHRASGRRLIDLTVTNPTRVGLPRLPDLLAPLSDPGSLGYEPDPRGLPTAREAIAADYARRGVVVPSDRLVVSASTSEGYGWLFKLLCDPGDVVLTPRPSYPLFEYLAGLEAVRTRPYPLGYDGNWHVDLEALRAAADASTRAVVVVSPNNPTGSFLTRSEIDAVAGLCAERGLALVSDEVFADFAFAPDPHRAGSAAADGPALAFALGGLSKSCALPQLKLAWIAVSGPPAACAEAVARLEIVADTYLSVGTPVQRAAGHWLARRAELQAPIHARLAENLDSLRSALSGSPASVLDVQGGWSAVVRVPATRGEEQWALDLLSEDVLVHPGYFFDFPREAFLVLSLLADPTEFSEAAARLRRAFATEVK